MIHDLGIIRRGHHLLYGDRCGRGKWLPAPAKRALVAAWNWLSCRVLGHAILVGGTCCACCAVVDWVAEDEWIAYLKDPCEDEESRDVVKGTPKMTLREQFDDLVRTGPVIVRLRADVLGVRVPPHLRGQAQVVLQFSPRYRGTLTVTERYVAQSLSFQGEVFACHVPWLAVVDVSPAVLAGTSAHGQLGRRPPRLGDEEP